MEPRILLFVLGWFGEINWGRILDAYQQSFLHIFSRTKILILGATCNSKVVILFDIQPTLVK